MSMIEEFIKEQEANSIGKSRIQKYRTSFNMVKKFYEKSFSKLTTEDLKEIVRKIEQSDYSEWTKHDLKVILRKFAKWLNKKHDKKIDTSFISIRVRNNNKLPEEILTQEEVERLVEVCNNIRDKTLISVLYESGARISELLGLKIKHVEFDDYGAVIIIPNGKTGSRRIRIVSSAQLLKNYFDTLPFKNSETFLWLTRFNRKNGNGYSRIDSQSVRKILREAAKKAGISKRIYPHLLRHSRATHLASFLTEAQMKEFFGWTQGSKMAGIYVHLSGKDIDNALLKAYGLKKEEEKVENIFLKFGDIRADFSSEKMLQLESLMIDFLKAIAEEFPQIKERFREMVKKRNAEDLFK